MPVQAPTSLLPPSGYTIVASDDTRLVLACHVDRDRWKKTLVSTSCMLFLPLFLIAALSIVLFSLMFGSHGVSVTIVSIERFLVIVALAIPVMFLYMQRLRGMLARAVIIELDRASNLFRMYAPGTPGGYTPGGYTCNETREHGTPGAGAPSRTRGHVKWMRDVSRSWILETCTFRLVAPGDPIGRALSTLRFTCRDQYLAVMQPAPGATPVPLLATGAVEHASALVDEMIRFKRGAAAVDDPASDAPRPATTG